MTDKEELRQRAEALARERTANAPANLSALSPEETRRALHELEVHQFELEIQNEEFRTTQVELAESRERYFDLYDLAPVGYCTLSEQGLILEANLTAATLLGTSRSALIKQPISRFILREDQDAYYLHRKQASDTGELQQCELRLVRPDGATLWAQLATSVTLDEHGTPACRVTMSDITDRKRVEAELIASETRYRRLFESAKDGILILDASTGEIMDVNPFLIDLLGYSREAFLGKHLWDIGIFKDKVENEKRFQELKRKGTIRYGHVPLETSDGRSVGVEFVGNVCDVNHTQVIQCNLRDITERKRMEKELESALSELSVIHENAPIVMLLVDRERKVRKVNGAAAKFANRAPEDMIGLVGGDALRCLNALDDLDGCGFGPQCKECLIRNAVLNTFEDRKNRESIETWLPFPSSGGEVKKCLQVSTSYLRFDGEDRVLVCAQDVTDHKRAEEAIKHRLIYERALSRISALAVQAGDLAEFLDESLTILGETTGVSRAYLFEHRHETDTMDNTVEWCSPEVSPQKDDLQGVPADSAPWWVATLQQGGIICFADIEDIPDEGTKEILRPQEILSILVVPIFAAGRYFGFLGFDECTRHRDWPASDVEILQAISMIIVGVIEHKRAEKEKENLFSQLSQAQKMESVGRLAGGVAHDFNNMLGVILAFTEMALDRVDPSDPLHADLEEIFNAAKRSADITRQLLAFARRQTIAPRVLDLNETVDGMLKMLRRLIGEDIDLAWHPAADLWPVKMDPNQVDQILANLCINARDAIEDVGEITIATGNSTFDEDYCAVHTDFTPGEYVLLTVSDNGCGMDPETLANLFEPFFTTKETGKGTGLGLATVYGVVKQNNGFINVYSEPGQGTAFKIYLSRHMTKTEPLLERPPDKPTAHGNEIILLVEDEAAILRIATRMLEGLGYTVLPASTPGEAIAIAREHAGTIDLLMTDVVMPEMNGRDLAKNLLSLYPDLKRLFMSGYTADVIAHHGVLDEGVYFIQKPFSVKDLGATVREALEG